MASVERAKVSENFSIQKIGQPENIVQKVPSFKVRKASVSDILDESKKPSFQTTLSLRREQRNDERLES